eukprot:6502811-Prymnesium_polylepis.1
MLIHWPGKDKATRQAQWRALEAWARRGKARAIGISHYCKYHLQEVLEIATLPVALNQNQVRGRCAVRWSRALSAPTACWLLGPRAHYKRLSLCSLGARACLCMCSNACAVPCGHGRRHAATPARQGVHGRARRPLHGLQQPVRPVRPARQYCAHHGRARHVDWRGAQYERRTGEPAVGGAAGHPRHPQVGQPGAPEEQPRPLQLRAERHRDGKAQRSDDARGDWHARPPRRCAGLRRGGGAAHERGGRRRGVGSRVTVRMKCTRDLCTQVEFQLFAIYGFRHPAGLARDSGSQKVQHVFDGFKYN